MRTEPLKGPHYTFLMRCGKIVHGSKLHSIWVDKSTTQRFTGLPEGTENESGKCKLLPEQYLCLTIDLTI